MQHGAQFHKICITNQALIHNKNNKQTKIHKTNQAIHQTKMEK